MHPQQKHALFNLIVLLCATVPFLLCYWVLLVLFGPKAAMAAFGFLGICGFLGFGGHFYRNKENSPAVIMDERDEDIKRRALVIAWAVDWFYWGLVCLGPWFVVVFHFGIEGALEPMIPIAWLPPVFCAMALVHVLAWSIAVLVLYEKGAGGDEA